MWALKIQEYHSKERWWRSYWRFKIICWLIIKDQLTENIGWIEDIHYKIPQGGAEEGQCPEGPGEKQEKITSTAPPNGSNVTQLSQLALLLCLYQIII